LILCSTTDLIVDIEKEQKMRKAKNTGAHFGGFQ
jgi:hypothetical protein